MNSPTFVKHCVDKLAHGPHLWQKVWEKKDLPHLRHPELYPETWLAEYSCPGVELIAWTVEYMHEGCQECEACADAAVERALHNGSGMEMWRKLSPVQHASGLFAEASHWATVCRV